MRKFNCSKCNNMIEPSRMGKQAYCKSCHAAYMRATRPKHSELPEPARVKANARSYLHVYLKRGKILRQNCEICGSERSEAHHDDYSKPLQVVWLCREHHLMLHKNEIAISQSIPSQAAIIFTLQKNHSAFKVVILRHQRLPQVWFTFEGG